MEQVGRKGERFAMACRLPLAYALGDPKSSDKGHAMSDPGIATAFDARLPNLAWPVRIGCYFDAQVFVRRWAIRDKDPAIRRLLRRMEKANSSEAIAGAIVELKRELAERGLLPDAAARIRE
jgi:hypothetical protein